MRFDIQVHVFLLIFELLLIVPVQYHCRLNRLQYPLLKGWRRFARPKNHILKIGRVVESLHAQNAIHPQGRQYLYNPPPIHPSLLLH